MSKKEKFVIDPEFEQFLKEQGIPLFMYKMLPDNLKSDIQNKYFELKESEEKKNVKC